MPLVINSEDYNGLSALKANAGDWIPAETSFSVRFSVGSGTSNKLTYNTYAGNYVLTLQNGDLGDYGFVDGDTVVLTYTLYGVPVPFQSQTFVTTILYVSGNQMFLADPFLINPPFNVEHSNGRQFPTDGFVSGLLIVSDKAPSSVEFQMNLTPNGTSSMGSVVDGEISRFELPVVTGIPTGVPQAMTQLANKSGSLIKDVELTLVSTPGSGWRNYRITYKFIQWGLIQNGNAEPTYLNGSDHIAPIVKVLGYSLYGNANGILTAVSQNTQADTGGFNENYNGGANNYEVISVEFFDALSNPIDAPDNSGESTFDALVSAPNQSDPDSTYRIGLVWRPVNGSFYQNIANTNLGENLLLNAPDQDFIGDGSVSAGPFVGYENANGARWDLEDVSFEVLPGDQLRIQGKIIPNAQASALFAGVPDGGRKTTLWVSLGRYDLPQIYDDRVSLKLFDEDNYDAPVLGVQIPNVIDQKLYDHGGNDVTVPDPQTTTEDDVLFISHFHLIEGVQYEGVRAGIWAYNTVTEEQFKLEEIYFDFTSVPYVSNKFEPNETQPRGFNLPPTSDRNFIRLTREPVLDSASLYAIKLEYGFLNDWRYWLEQSNVNDDFFDQLEPFNGKNKNWQRFSNSGDWVIRLSYFTRLNGVDDFNHFNFGIRPYEDEDANTTWDITVLSSGANPSNFVANELHEVSATIVWNVGAYTNPWAEIAIEDFEGARLGVVSTQLAQGGVTTNPLKPISGIDFLDIQFPAVNIAVLTFLVDTGVISANEICLSDRIYSEDKPIPPEWEWLVPERKDALGAYSVARKLSPDSVYSGPLIRVRRGLDNAEMDVPYIQVGTEYVLDEAALLSFATQAWVVTRYDQSGNGKDATQTFLADQAPIVIDGQVVKDPATNRPAMLCDGTNHFAPLSLPIETERDMLAISVFNRESAGDNAVGFGSSASSPFTMLWLGVFEIIYDGLGNIGTNNIHFTGQTQTGPQLNMVWRDTSNDIRMRLNGVNGTIINEVNGDPQLTSLEQRTTNLHDGYKSEDVVWGRGRLNTDVWIENNVNNFYSIF